MTQVGAIRVMTKASKRGGLVNPAAPTEYTVVIAPDRKRITIFKDSKEVLGTVEVCRSFGVGEQVTYDSYNLIYTGTIESITNKGVAIWTGYYNNGGSRSSHPSGDSPKKEIKRLGLNEFCWRNYNFDAEKVAAKNADTMMYI